jgi:hypothetical protein
MVDMRDSGYCLDQSKVPFFMPPCYITLSYRHRAVVAKPQVFHYSNYRVSLPPIYRPTEHRHPVLYSALIQDMQIGYMHAALAGGKV